MRKSLSNKIYKRKFSLDKSDSIKIWLESNKASYFILAPLFFLFLISIYPQEAVNVSFLLLNILFILSQAFKLLLVLFSFFKKGEQEPLKPIIEYPIYTILLPVYREEKIIDQLIKAVRKIDYPVSKLDVKILVEKEDNKTREKLSKLNLPFYMKVLIVPESFPKTKPKACNYGLKFAKGKYLVVYDAEDQPSPNQLKLVTKLFSVLPKDYVCIQAALNYYNGNYNYLTKFFSLEYALLFNFLLRGLNFFKMPIPLGGSSNHFITDKLIELGGWDAFNVTEDADLGLRLYRRKYKCCLMENQTLEESPITIKSWIFQRSRWMKGHILTSILNFHRLKYFNVKEIIGIIFFLYLPNLNYLLSAALIIICMFLQIFPIFYKLCFINFLLMIFIPILSSLIVSKKIAYKIDSSVILISPLYFFLFPLAAIRAFIQIFSRPYFWDKTEHGYKFK